jgi:hypothetical protein
VHAFIADSHEKDHETTKEDENTKQTIFSPLPSMKRDARRTCPELVSTNANGAERPKTRCDRAQNVALPRCRDPQVN